MQIKHTFLFTWILGLVWTGFLFAFVNGPVPGSNGVFGDVQACATAGCHSGAPVNAPGGSITLSGLPAAGWVAGQTYPLTVTIQRTGQRLFGFQLSAVADGSNQQAGALAAGARTKVICGNSRNMEVNCSTADAIQYAEHSNAQVQTSTYTVNWTAPANASFGTVRFNVAGNAANGDITPLGDFIYTSIVRLSPATISAGSPTREFSIADRGGSSAITDGSGDLSVGYSRIQPTSGSTTPAGVAIFGFRQGNILVSEAGVPASPPITSGRIFAEVNGPVNTGLAIANPNGEAATITFHFTNTAGADFGNGSTTIGANQQIASFLDQTPFNGGSSVQGTFSFTSNVPVSVIALRGFTNERGEFLITTLPVTDVSAPTSAEPASLSHFADGGGWMTQIILVNPTDATIAGSVQFLNQGTASSAAAPVTMVASAQGGTPQTATSFTYSIPRRGSFKLVTAGSAAALTSGSVRVTPTAGVAPSALVVFSYKPIAVTVAEAGVPAIRGNTFRMYVEATGAGSAVDTIQTGLAISNTSPTATTANLELFDLDGTPTGLPPVTLALPGNGQVSTFVHEIFPLTFPFKGILRISGGGASGISVVGLRGRYNERGDFLITTTPPSNEANAPSPVESLFPHLVNGGGYTTQFVLFSGTAGQTSNGTLRFFRQNGAPFELTVN